MKPIVKAALVLTGVIVSVTAFATYNHYRYPEAKAQWVVDEVTEELTLTEPQQEKLVVLKDQMLEVRKATKEMLMESRDQFTTLFETSNLNQEQALTLIQSHTEFVNQAAPVLVAAFGDFYDSLTPEQQTEIRTFLEEHRKHHDHHWKE